MPLTKPRKIQIKNIRVLRAPEIGAKGNQVEQEVAQREAPCFQPVSWIREPHLRKLYAMGAVLMLASATTGYDGMLVNTSQQIDRWKQFFPETQVADGREQWVADSYLGLLVNMFNIGSIMSFFITPHIADHYGRKTAIGLGCGFMVSGGLITGCCTGYGMYVAGRFVLGFGNSLSQMASPLLLTEICHPQHRGPVTAVYNCLWNAGALIVAWVGWGTSQIDNDWSWRSITLGQVLPSLVQLAFLYWIPESPRYLMSKRRHEEALDILTEYHGGGNELNATVQFEYREIKETMRMEQEFASDAGYLDFFRTRGNRWRLAILVSLGVISQYSGNAIFSNYMDAVYIGAGIVDQDRKLALSGGKTCLDLIVTVLAALHVDYFGRRPLFLISTAGMVVCFAAWTACGAAYENAGLDKSSPAGWAQLVFIWLFGIFYDIGFSGLLIAYALEILPFKLRAKGMMIMNVTVQAILALSNQTNKVAWNRMPLHWHLMLFYTAWDFVQFVFVYFFYVETKGPTLEEIARIFDGFDAEVANINMRQVERDIDDAEHRKRRSRFGGGGGDGGEGGGNMSSVHHRYAHHHHRDDKAEDFFELDTAASSTIGRAVGTDRDGASGGGKTTTTAPAATKQSSSTSSRLSRHFNSKFGSLRSHDSWLPRLGTGSSSNYDNEDDNNNSRTSTTRGHNDDTAAEERRRRSNTTSSTSSSGRGDAGAPPVQIYKTTTMTATYSNTPGAGTSTDPSDRDSAQSEPVLSASAIGAGATWVTRASGGSGSGSGNAGWGGSGSGSGSSPHGSGGGWGGTGAGGMDRGRKSNSTQEYGDYHVQHPGGNFL